ncbi:MAG: DUF2062 domain-containing protein [Hyphomicrobiaceae bacterium]
MLFSRREAEPFAERMRVALWPRRSWSRSLRYARLRLGRIGAPPREVALGLAIGVFMAFQPVLGLQMLLAGGIAMLVGGNIAAALLGTFVGGPVTWPVMWLASYHLGAVIVGAPHTVTLAELWSAVASATAIASPEHAGAAAGSLVRRVLVPVAVGAVPLGLLSAAAIYAMVLGARAPAARRARAGAKRARG